MEGHSAASNVIGRSGGEFTPRPDLIPATAPNIATPSADAGFLARHRARLPLVVASFVTRVVDGLAIILAGVLLIRWQMDAMVIDHARETFRMAIFGAACFIVLAEISGAYLLDTILSRRRYWPPLISACAATTLFLLAFNFATGTGIGANDYQRAILIGCGMATGAIVSARLALLPIFSQLRRAGVFNKRTAILGTGRQAIDLARYVMGHDMLAVSLVGFFDDRTERRSREQLPLAHLGGMRELMRSIRAGMIDKVIIAMPWAAESRLQCIMEALGTTPVEIRLAPEWAGYAWAQRPVLLLGGLPVLTLLETPLSGWKLFVKAVEDRLLSLIALVLLSPVLLAAAIAIRLDSPGPIFFRQLREGYNCRPFSILKFRTMYADQCHRGGDMVQTTRDDPRVTRVGAFLRRTSIDELPQLFNVLTGAMSLVGPRPHAATTRAGGKLFAEIRTSYATRHNVKPGLTGWAQVCGWRGETTSEEMLVNRLQHDLYYVERCSLMFDLYILARTAMIVLFQRTAY